MNKVFVIQKQLKLNATNGELESKYDLTSAQSYGELVYLLSPTAGPFNTESVIAELKEKLSDYTPDDHLLLIGNPCLIGWAVALAARQTGGVVSLLQWHGRSRSYLPVKADLWSKEVAAALR